MSYKKDSSDSVNVKLLGSLTKIEAVRNVLQRNFKVLKSGPIYDNDREPGYHTYLTLGEDLR